MTEIREEHFGIDLPGEWEEVESADEGTWSYRDTKSDAKLTVTLLGVRPMYAIADQRRLIEDYMQHRAKYEQGLSESLRQSDYESTEGDGVLQGTWGGVDVRAARRTLHHVLLVEGVLADFLYESSEPIEPVFTPRAVEALSTAKVTAP
ncbi:MAG: hypothetical protein HY876_07100 [Coriobacteriales bacterium]|nr:hypothetical protein [Coriobacteriales bacterium]